MKNSIGIYKRIVSLIVLTVMVLGLVPSVSAAEAKTVDEIISQSVVLEVKTPYYLKNGKQFNYSDNQYYYPQLVNNELMVPLRMLNSVLDFQYSYNSKKEEATNNGKLEDTVVVYTTHSEEMLEKSKEIDL